MYPPYDCVIGSVDVDRAARVPGIAHATVLADPGSRLLLPPRHPIPRLAALVAVKVRALGRLKPGEPPVAVDISGSWAREHIIRVLSLEIMDVYSNHTFQPGAIVRRGDVALAVGRVLDLLKWPTTPAPNPSDMSPNNILYDGVRRAVAAGLMDLTPAGAFEAWRPVTGQEAVDVIEGLIRAIGR